MISLNPGSRTAMTRPRRKCTPRSYCLTNRIAAASSTSAATATATMTKAVILAAIAIPFPLLPFQVPSVRAHHMPAGQQVTVAVAQSPSSSFSAWAPSGCSRESGAKWLPT